MNGRIFPNIMLVLLAISLVGGGCATTSSQTASGAKPHKPQVITGDEEHEGLPDSVIEV
jgi:hypothetical protein